MDFRTPKSQPPDIKRFARNTHYRQIGGVRPSLQLFQTRNLALAWVLCLGKGRKAARIEDAGHVALKVLQWAITATAGVVSRGFFSFLPPTKRLSRGGTQPLNTHHNLRHPSSRPHAVSTPLLTRFTSLAFTAALPADVSPTQKRSVYTCTNNRNTRHDRPAPGASRAKQAKMARYPNYVPEEETIRNDFPQRYAERGEWPQNWVQGAEPEQRFEDHPKQQQLLALKKASVASVANAPMHSPLSLLITNTASVPKFDAIPIDPPYSSSFSRDELENLPIATLAAHHHRYPILTQTIPLAIGDWQRPFHRLCALPLGL